MIDGGKRGDRSLVNTPRSGVAAGHHVAHVPLCVKGTAPREDTRRRLVSCGCGICFQVCEWGCGPVSGAGRLDLSSSTWSPLPPRLGGRRLAGQRNTLAGVGRASVMHILGEAWRKPRPRHHQVGASRRRPPTAPARPPMAPPGRPCVLCGSSERLKFCSRCQVVRYCGPKCQQADVSVCVVVGGGDRKKESGGKGFAAFGETGVVVVL